MVHFAPSEDRLESTRTRVLRDPELVPVALIRPTNEVFPPDCRKIKYSPICLVKDSDGFLYVVDGNHRFHKKAYFEKECSKILAWILREEDRDKIAGKSIPAILVEWIAGKFTLRRLGEMAYAEANSATRRDEHLPSTSILPSRPNKTIFPVRVNQIKNVPEWPATRKFELVMQILRDDVSMKLW